jgi:hypothetical protein
MALAISWDILTLEVAGFSTWASLATSPNGDIGVAYHSTDIGGVRYAEIAGGGVPTIAGIESTGDQTYPSLKYRFGRPCISYSDNVHQGGDPMNRRRELTLATRGGPGTGWRTARVAPTDQRDSSVAIDTTGHIAVVYGNQDRAVAYARPDSSLSVWVGSAIDDPETGRFNSAAFDPADRLAAAYSADVNNETWIKYAIFDGAQWARDTIGEGWGWITLAFAPSGEPAVTYIQARGTVNSVIYATRVGTMWRRAALASPAGSPSVAFSPIGEPAVSYHDESAQAIKLAMYVDRAWQHVLVEQSGKDQQGLWHGDFTLTSLAFTPSGQPAVAYYDRHNGTIRVAVGTITSS